MDNRFVILVDGAPREERDKLTEFLRAEKGVYFWHHFADSWLVITSLEKWDASTLRDAAKARISTASIMVLKVDISATPPRWASRAPEKSTEWIKTHWIP